VIYSDKSINNIKDIKNMKGVYYFWHQNIIAGAFFFFKIKLKGYCVVSPSSDGKFMGHVIRHMGFKILYGSPFKSPVQLTRQALKVLKEEGQICLVGDGSRGPAFTLQPGVSYLAGKSDVPLVYIECHAGRAVTLKKSWDKFQIPLPFSKIYVTVHAPYFVIEPVKFTGKIVHKSKGPGVFI
jgi:lysophospholipid acyltransferase (LPLAT)-like uncharacterized protein